MLESELFGHERGAFTGAQTLRRGRFEQAEGGTLFLDEIGDMPFDLQTRLLRVLSDGQFYRVGGHQAVQANVRVIAATHQNLEQRVTDGAFREDLFHRLNVIRLRLPPLRERHEDIPALTRHFLALSARQLGVQPKQMSAPALTRLAGFSFPGNVRQLENICHWLTVMAPSQVIETKDLPPEVLAVPPRADAVAAPPPAPPPSAIAEVPAFAPTPRSGQGGAVYETSAATPAAYVPPVRMPGTGLAAAGTPAPDADASIWEADLEAEAARLLAEGHPDVWDRLMHRVEARLIHAALASTRGRRIEAAQRLGIGRNTITRKIQELGLDD